MNVNCEKTNKRGGFRVGSGRKKKCVKRITFSANQEVLDILNTLECNQSDFICQCITEKGRDI